MWVLIIAIVILIIYVIFVTKKEPAKKANLLEMSAGNPSPSPIIIAPPVVVSQETFSINDQIYAGADLINTYTSCPPSSTNIANTYKQGDLIGTFLRREGFCIVIAIKTYPFGYSWIPIEGSENVYLPSNALIYKQ